MVHRVTFDIDNQTQFRLAPTGHFTQWGEMVKAPVTVPPQNTPSPGNGGIFQASAAPLTGSAGMVGYEITDGSNTLGLAFLGSDPDWSTEGNCSRCKASTPGPIYMNQTTYNDLFDNGNSDCTANFAGGTIKVHSDIGTADDCYATFSLTFTRNN